MNYLLDTSAVLAHFRREPGHEQVQELFQDATASILLSAPTLLEMDVALKPRIPDEGERHEVVEFYGGRLAEVVSVDSTAVEKAIVLKNASSRRIPAMDALVAGCALAHSATLVHRDPHFDAIPPERLQVLRLNDRPESATSHEAPPAVRETSAGYVTHKRTKSRSSVRTRKSQRTAKQGA